MFKTQTNIDTAMIPKIFEMEIKFQATGGMSTYTMVVMAGSFEDAKTLASCPDDVQKITRIGIGYPDDEKRVIAATHGF